MNEDTISNSIFYKKKKKHTKTLFQYFCGGLTDQQNDISN